MGIARRAYPNDITDDEWVFVASYLTLMREGASQRQHDLREVFHGLGWLVGTGSPSRYMPNDLPPWETLYQQAQGWIAAGVFESMAMNGRSMRFDGDSLYFNCHYGDGIPPVAVNNVHYHLPKSKFSQVTFVCIRHLCTLRETGFRFFPNGGSLSQFARGHGAVVPAAGGGAKNALSSRVSDVACRSYEIT